MFLAKMILLHSWSLNLKTKFSSEAHEKKAMNFLKQSSISAFADNAFLQISALFLYTSQLQQNHKEDQPFICVLLPLICKTKIVLKSVKLHSFSCIYQNFGENGLFKTSQLFLCCLF